jgi:phosphoribosylanthranilate isomerase
MFRIKICGVTTVEDALLAAEAGADAVGLNFYAKSPRFVTMHRAEEIVRCLPPTTMPVGVFVETTYTRIKEIAEWTGLRAIQTYDIPFLAEMEVHPFGHLPAFRIRDEPNLRKIEFDLLAAQKRSQLPAAVLIDSYLEGLAGGSGHPAPWHLLAGFQPVIPWILAGGLNPENVGTAIALTHPWGVDVASGVESSPGRKDRNKVVDFVRAVRDAANQLACESIS